MVSIVPVILSGGSGTRLWPLSTAERPKQFHALNTSETLFSETLVRLSGELYEQPMIVCNRGHLDWINADAQSVNIDPAAVILEPVGRNTAPAIALATLLAADRSPDTLMLVAACDSAIENRRSFERAVRAARSAAEAGFIATFGLRPTRPETGYGYIRRGEPIDGGEIPVFKVAEFVEKPDQETAERYVESGEYTWNSSMFLFRARVLLDELERQRPDILAGCRRALAGRHENGSVVYPDEAAFTAIDGESIDYAVMERCPVAAVVEADFGWNDIGSWQALWEISKKDTENNVISGRVIATDVQRCLLRTDGTHRIAIAGCDDLIVVVEGDTILVTPRERSQDVKSLAESAEEI